MKARKWGLRVSRPIEIIIVLFILLILAAILFPVFAQSRGGCRRSCVSNVKEQALVLLMYAEDYDNRLPRAAKWMDAGLPYIKFVGVYQCPNLPDKLTSHQDWSHPTVFGYAFNNEFSAQLTTEVSNPEKALLIYDSNDLRWNASAPGFTGMAYPPRHSNGTINIFGFVDGHARTTKLLPDPPQGSE